jgi:hypothetical protein
MRVRLITNTHSPAGRKKATTTTTYLLYTDCATSSPRLSLPQTTMIPYQQLVHLERHGSVWRDHRSSSSYHPPPTLYFPRRLFRNNCSFICPFVILPPSTTFDSRSINLEHKRRFLSPENTLTTVKATWSPSYFFAFFF